MSAIVSMSPFLQGQFFAQSVKTSAAGMAVSLAQIPPLDAPASQDVSAAVPAHLLPGMAGGAHQMALGAGWSAPFASRHGASRLRTSAGGDPSGGRSSSDMRFPDRSSVRPTDVVVELPEGFDVTEDGIKAKDLLDVLMDELDESKTALPPSRLSADLAKFNHIGGKMAYLNRLLAFLQAVGWNNFDLVCRISEEIASILDKLAPETGQRVMMNGADFQNVFAGLFKMAINFERAAIRRGEHGPEMAEKTANVIFAYARWGSMFYAFGHRQEQQRLRTVIAIVETAQRYAHLGLADKAAEARKMLAEVKAVFCLPKHPYDWAMERVEKDAGAPSGVPEFVRCTADTLDMGIPFEFRRAEIYAERFASSDPELSADFRDAAAGLRKAGLAQGYLNEDETVIPGIGRRDPSTGELKNLP